MDKRPPRTAMRTAGWAWPTVASHPAHGISLPSRDWWQANSSAPNVGPCPCSLGQVAARSRALVMLNPGMSRAPWSTRQWQLGQGWGSVRHPTSAAAASQPLSKSGIAVLTLSMLDFMVDVVSGDVVVRAMEERSDARPRLPTSNRKACSQHGCSRDQSERQPKGTARDLQRRPGPGTRPPRRHCAVCASLFAVFAGH